MAIRGQSPFYFVMRNRAPIHPDITLDGILLYYDMRGKRNDSEYKDFIFDMSGNDNSAALDNFRFDTTSGYTDGLEFNDYQNKLKLPQLSITLQDGFNLQINDHIYNYSLINGITTVKDGLIVPATSYPTPEEVLHQITVKKYLEGNFLIDSGYYQNKNGWFLREDLVIHTVKIYKRPLTPEEMLRNYRIEKDLFYIDSVPGDAIDRKWSGARWVDHNKKWSDFISE